MNKINNTSIVISLCALAGCARNDVEMTARGATIGGYGTPVGTVASIVLSGHSLISSGSKYSDHSGTYN